MMNNTYLIHEAKAWIKRKDGTGEIIRILADIENSKTIMTYLLYSSFDADPDYLGRVLFDAQGYWIYDGNILTVVEQEQIAKFIINYVRIFTKE